MSRQPLLTKWLMKTFLSKFVQLSLSPRLLHRIIFALYTYLFRHSFIWHSFNIFESIEHTFPIDYMVDLLKFQKNLWNFTASRACRYYVAILLTNLVRPKLFTWAFNPFVMHCVVYMMKNTFHIKNIVAQHNTSGE